MTAQDERTLPEVNTWLFWLFSRYNTYYISRNFHDLRLHTEWLPPEDAEPPLLFYLNHPSWWDPLVCLELINQFWPDRFHFTAMEREQLEEHSFFRKLGVFGVDLESDTAGVSFFRTAMRLLQQEDHALWLTPRGEFADARKRPLEFQEGLGLLASQLDRGTLIPVALQYSFWTETRPEILVGFGTPTCISEYSSRFPEHGRTDLTAHLEQRLLKVLDPLLKADLHRDEAPFYSLMDSPSGFIQGAVQSLREWGSGTDSSDKRTIRNERSS